MKLSKPVRQITALKPILRQSYSREHRHFPLAGAMEEKMLMRLMTLATWLMLVVCFLAGAAIAMAAPMTGTAVIPAGVAAAVPQPDRDQDIYEFDHLPPPASDRRPSAGAVRT
jgi:hypothetical protein